MKKYVLLVLIICVLAFSACSPNSKADVIERYSVGVGEKVFVQDERIPTSVNAFEITLPANCSFVSVVDKDVYFVKSNGLFGMVAGGKIVIECKYESISSSGKFVCGTYVDIDKELTDDEILYGSDSNTVNDVYYLDGVKLLEITGSISYEAINDDYCALYYDSYSQVFDKNGLYYFNDRNKVSARFRYSICDGLLFGHDSSRGDWFIWELQATDDGEKKTGNSFILNFYTSDANTIYALAYLGDGEFAVVETRSTEDDYDYYDFLNDDKFYFKQSCVIFDPLRGRQRTVELEKCIFGFINEYSPDLSIEQKLRMNLSSGYTAVSTPVLSEDKRRISSAYYVVDKQMNFVIRYPSTISPTAIRFKDGYGFCGEATSNYAAALYYVNCDVVWLLDDASYYGQSFNYGRYVLAKVTDDGLRYGVLDADGSVIADYAYSFVSPYTATSAIASIDGEYYRLDLQGEKVTLTNVYDDTYLTYFGVYGYLAGEKIGVKNFDGDVLIAAEYDSVDYVGRSDALYILLSKGKEQKLFILE